MLKKKSKLSRNSKHFQYCLVGRNDNPSTVPNSQKKEESDFVIQEFPIEAIIRSVKENFSLDGLLILPAHRIIIFDLLKAVTKS